MFIVRLVAWLISLPLLWAGQLASLFKLPVAVPLLEAAWRIGGDGYVANAALANRRRYESTEAVLAKASDWLAQRPCPQIAAHAGLVAMTEGDLHTAQQLLARGRELGDEPRGSLDLLEACLVCKSDDKAAGDELVARWTSRRDLSPAVSEFVLQSQLLDAIFRHAWAEVEQRAKHLWSIKNDCMAAAAFWALDRQRGHDRSLMLAMKQIDAPPANALLIAVQTYSAVGATAEAAQAMLALQQVDPLLAERTRKHLEQQERIA